MSFVPENATPTSINHIPVELYTSIFKFLFALSSQPSPLNVDKRAWHESTGEEDESESDDLPPSSPCSAQLLEWTEKDVRSPSLFPFNVARVSKLWRDILSLAPEYWTRVVFDVAKDPTPLLDAFLWSENLEGIEVVVFNSDNPQVVDKARENSRAAAIAQALQSHIYRCKSIIFDVSYSTSLPSPTLFFLRESLHLENITLDCCIDDLDLESDVRATKANANRRHFATYFPKLKRLSLTGFWFMYLALQARDSKWLNQLKYDFLFSLTISHFKFPKHGMYKLPKFFSYVSRLPRPISLYFRDLSLSYAYAYDDRECGYVCELTGDIYFQSVSKDFLRHVHAVIDICADEMLSFEACEIPEIDQPHAGHCLVLKNITNNDDGRGLRQILEAWTGCDLTIISCPSFDDTILSWLALEIECPPSPDREPSKAFPAMCMTSLTVDKCDNFSIHAMKELLRLRNEAYFAEAETLMDDDDDGEKSGMEYLHVTVSREGPMLTDEDQRWFEEDGKFTMVHWMVQDEQGTRESFRTPSED